MGLRYSAPVPTDADFLIKHKPLDNPLSTKKTPLMEHCFRIHRNAWKMGACFHVLGIKLVPVEQSDRCLITDQEGGLLAVLQVKKHREIQICSLTPCNGTKKKAAVGEYNGKPIYEYAVVVEKENRYRHTLSVGAVVYQMERCGSRFGPKDVVIHQHDNGQVCAYVTEEPQRMRGCRIGPGVDPALMVAFVACSGRLRALLEESLTQKSGITSMRTSNVIHP